MSDIIWYLYFSDLFSMIISSSTHVAANGMFHSSRRLSSIPLCEWVGVWECGCTCVCVSVWVWECVWLWVWVWLCVCVWVNDIYKETGASLDYWWLRWWRICLQCKRPWFDPWVGKIRWRREWQPTPEHLLGEFQGQRSLAGYSPWGRKEPDTAEWVTRWNIKNTKSALGCRCVV